MRNQSSKSCNLGGSKFLILEEISLVMILEVVGR